MPELARMHVVEDEEYLNKAIEAWLDAKWRLSNSPQTQRNYRGYITRFRAYLVERGLSLNPYADLDDHASTMERQRALATLSTAAQMFAGKAERVEKVSSSTYNQVLAALGSFYDFAIRRRFLYCENPIASVDRAKTEGYAGIEPMNVFDLRSHIQAIDRSSASGARDYAILGVFFATGRRASEVLSLRWKHVTFVKPFMQCESLDDIALKLHFERCKGGKQHRSILDATISRAVIEWLCMAYSLEDIRYLGDERLGWAERPLWCRIGVARATLSRHEALRYGGLTCIFEKRLGTSRVHRARHTFASAMDEAGAKVTEIKDALGHSDLSVTTRYLAALRQGENAYAGKINDALGFSV